MNLDLFLTKKALTVLAIVVAAVTWFVAHATKIQIPLGISKEDALAGLASIAAALGIAGASPLPGGTLFKTAGAVQAAAEVQAANPIPAKGPIQ